MRVPSEKNMIQSLKVTVVIFFVDMVIIVIIKTLGKKLWTIYATTGNCMHLILIASILLRSFEYIVLSKLYRHLKL
jgi:hypothetical protein